ncbi:hypothetical protein TNCV_4499311 [Trichonephila clavipes]|nr:hypothetical protein TNCV_4499311 [Trichonephila clavipes]
MANAFWVSVRNNISKRWNTTENDVSKNQSSADYAIRLPNTRTSVVPTGSPRGVLGTATRFAAAQPQQPSRTIGVGRSGYVGTCEFWADLSPPTRGLSAAVH